tara:strand:+ start:31993 stop:32958 length:966 start_codon:yes stop_codon:yes gene_type:complete
LFFLGKEKRKANLMLKKAAFYNMKKSHLILLILVATCLMFLTASGDFLKHSSNQIEDPNTIIIDSIEREYFIHLPENLPTNAPLVLVFHGYSGNALSTMQTMSFNQIADRQGFAVCYPQGLVDNEGNGFWQVGYDFHKNFEIDDVKFTIKLVERLQKMYALSKTNIFITGFSNGGDFCNLLTCKTDGIFKATAPIISCFMKTFYDSCQVAKPIPTFMLNGTDDPITFWGGDLENKQGYGAYLPTQKMVDFRLKQIQYDAVIRDTVRSADPNEKTLVSIDKYSNAQSKNQIWMYSYENGGHGHPDYLDLEEEIWRFFDLYIN